jgi:hypothetical protein
MGDHAATTPQPLDTLLADLPPTSADLARAALDWLLPEDGELTDLDQLELQEFLWYLLPVKSLVETSELHEVAWSLADLFTAAGYERYASLCRAPQTHELLDAWLEEDHEPARKAMREAIASSGVDPPDTPLLAWGAVFGDAEHSARLQVSQALEQAVDAGELVPGERGWKQQAARITEVSLPMPRLELRGESMFQSVRRELPELAALSELARRTRLVTRKGRKVALSAKGRRALRDPDLLWRVAVAGVFSPGTFEGEGAALAAAALVMAGRPMPRSTVEATVGAGLRGRWRTAAGGVARGVVGHGSYSGLRAAGGRLRRDRAGRRLAHPDVDAHQTRTPGSPAGSADSGTDTAQLHLRSQRGSRRSLACDDLSAG